MLWNTRYLDAAVAQLRGEGHIINDEELAHLSPSEDRHTDFPGRHLFNIEPGPAPPSAIPTPSRTSTARRDPAFERRASGDASAHGLLREPHLLLGREVRAARGGLVGAQLFEHVFQVAVDGVVA
ncbi:Tn3 family transposase [Streptomyces sp. NPDC047706]|uniref:Tn3 family transposase n=1 Tax=Streptomyces sp. NPDC047706 TaxID=3365486 RepID=UPI0037246C1E